MFFSFYNNYLRGYYFSVIYRILWENLSKNRIICISLVPEPMSAASLLREVRFRLGKKKFAFFALDPSFVAMGKPPVLSYRLHPVRESEPDRRGRVRLSRAARTIPPSRISGRTAIAGKLRLDFERGRIAACRDRPLCLSEVATCPHFVHQRKYKGQSLSSGSSHEYMRPVGGRRKRPGRFYATPTLIK